MQIIIFFFLIYFETVLCCVAKVDNYIHKEIEQIFYFQWTFFMLYKIIYYKVNIKWLKRLFSDIPWLFYYKRIVLKNKEIWTMGVTLDIITIRNREKYFLTTIKLFITNCIVLACFMISGYLHNNVTILTIML